MVAECDCGAPLDEQDVRNAGMEEICFNCWNDRVEKTKDVN